MAEIDAPDIKKTDSSAASGIKPGSKWFKKIPKDILLSPGGMILIFFALVLEVTDLLIPPSLVDSLLIEMIPELVFCAMLHFIADIPFSSQLIPFLIERIPIVSDIVPTWLLKLFFF